MHWYFTFYLCAACVCVWCMCTCVCAMAWKGIRCLALLPPTLFPWEKVSWRTRSWAGSQQAPVSFLSLPLASNGGISPPYLAFYIGDEDLNLGPHASAVSPFTSWAIPPAPKMHFDLQYFQHSVSLSWGLQQRINNPSFALIALNASIRVLFP